MNAELHSWSNQVIGALLNSVYQGILISLLVALLLRCCGRTNATTRHAVWFATLLLVALLAPAHYFLDRPAPVDVKFPSAGVETVTALPADQTTVENPAPELTLPQLFEGEAALEALPADGAKLDIAKEPGEKALDVAGPVPAATAQPALSKHWADLLPVLYRTAKICLQPISWNNDSVIGSTLVLFLALVWSTAAGCGLVLLSWRIVQLRKLLVEAVPADLQANEVFVRLLSDTKVRRPVDLRISERQRTPLVMGFVRPTILLPRSMAANVALLEQVLQHELAHVRRYDDWTNLVQHLIQTVMFFHPAVLWIGRRLCLEREIACDDHVLQLASSRRNYAMLLADLAGQFQHRAPALAPGISSNRSQLQQRISMILNTRRNSSPGLGKAGFASIFSIAAVLAALSVYAAPRLVLAGSPDNRPALQNGSAASTAPGATVAVSSTDLVGEPSPVVAESDQAVVNVVGVDSAPKFKPEDPTAEPSAPAAEITPEPPEPPSPDVTVRVKRRMARAGKPGNGLQPPDFPGADGPDDSIEARLRKLEKMVRALMDQQSIKHTHSSFEFKDGGNQNWNADQAQADRIKEMTERQAARAAEQAQRTVEKAERATRDMQARMDQQQQARGDSREAFEKQVEALRKAREGLGREMERLDRQIEKLEQERDQKETQPRRGDAVRERLHADVSAAPDVSVAPNVTLSPDKK